MTTKRATLPLSDALQAHTLDLLNSIQPSDIFIGQVTRVNPLEISIDQKHILSEGYLQLTNAVRDYSVDVTVSWETVEDKHKHGNGNEGQDTTEVSHKHNISGRKKIIIHNGLTNGEWVILFRKQGGNDYVVIDRTIPPQTKGEWV